MKNCIIFTGIILSILSPVFSQNKPTAVTPDARVRVLVSSDFQKAEKRRVVKDSKQNVYIGTVMSFNAEQLVVNCEEEAQPLIIPASFLRKLEVSRGKKSRAGKRAATGLGAGVALGAAVGAILGGGFGECYFGDDPPDGVSNQCSKEFAVMGGAGFGLLGLAIGTISGAVAGPADDWIEVPLDTVLKANQNKKDWSF